MKPPLSESGSISVFRWFAGLQLAIVLPALIVRTFIFPTEQESL